MFSAAPCVVSAVPTTEGEFHLVASSEGLLRLFFPDVSRSEAVFELERSGFLPGEVEVPPPWLESAREQLAGYFRGETKQLRAPLDLRAVSKFQRKIYQALTAVPYGETVSYGELGRRVGSPRGARAVGMAMRCNTVPIFVPCHRVVRAGGGAGGWSGPPGWKEKLLALEGLAFVDRF